MDEDGERFFLHKATGESAWVVPVWLLAFDFASEELFYVNAFTHETRWDRPASGYAGVDEGGWELVWHVKQQRALFWHAESGASVWQEQLQGLAAGHPPKPSAFPGKRASRLALD